MEPLVLVSVVVVLIYGYRTVMEVLKDIESEGSWNSLREYLHNAFGAAGALRLRTTSRCRKTYYNNFFTDPQGNRPRLLVKPHA